MFSDSALYLLLVTFCIAMIGLWDYTINVYFYLFVIAYLQLFIFIRHYSNFTFSISIYYFLRSIILSFLPLFYILFEFLVLNSTIIWLYSNNFPIFFSWIPLIFFYTFSIASSIYFPFNNFLSAINPIYIISFFNNFQACSTLFINLLTIYLILFSVYLPWW